MKFIKSNLQALEPRKSNYFVMDDALEFFGIRVYPTGKKVFSIRLRQNGKAKIYKVGDYPAVTVTQARKLAQDLILRYQAGEDVKEIERLEKGKNRSLRSCFDEYLTSVKPTTKKDVERAMSEGLNGWLDKPIKDISPEKVLIQYDKRVRGDDQTNPARNRARLEMAYLRAVWNYNKKELGLCETPTTILNEERKGWNTTRRKSRRLDFETASKFYQEIQKFSVRDKNFFLLVYFTGMRGIEAKNLLWEYVNLKSKSLHIPGTETKNGKPLDIPLTTQLITIFSELKNESPFVFSQVARSGKKKGNITAMTSYTTGLALLKKNGVEWSPHDSRRGYIVAGGVLGINSYMVKQMVNHYDAGDVHAGYQHYTVAELRESAQKIADYLESQLMATGNVVEFKKSS